MPLMDCLSFHTNSINWPSGKTCNKSLFCDILYSQISPDFCRPVEVPVYNITNAEHRKKPMGFIIEMSKKVNQEYPLNAGLWYPDPCVTTNKLYHLFNVTLFHWLPAYFLDFLMLILGQKRL